jgi:ABC-type multidrug transport system fused ATPase/permease subunit
MGIGLTQIGGGKLSALGTIVGLVARGKPPTLAHSVTATPGANAAGGLHEQGALRGVFRTYCWQILVTYALFMVENLLRLAQPYLLGLAINDLLGSSCRGVVLFVVQHAAFVLVSICRRRYDARAYRRIYADVAGGLVQEQRRRGVVVTAVTARSALAREFITFFERDVPVMMYALFSVVGALVMLGTYDWLLVPCCLGLLFPLYLVNRSYGHKTYLLNNGLNDELEREVQVIAAGEAAEVRGHYERVGRWHVELSDRAAVNFDLIEVFVLGLMIVVLARSCAMPGSEVGSVFALLRYAIMFVSGLDCVPALVGQLSRLRDIGRRLRQGSEGPQP